MSEALSQRFRAQSSPVIAAVLLLGLWTAPSASARLPLVTPGHTVMRYGVGGFSARERITVVVTPSAARGGNCCGYLVRQRWRAGTDGTAEIRFTFPAYYNDCVGHSCDRRRWRSGSTAAIDFSGGQGDDTQARVRIS
jgi:hypothetical protein